MAHDIVEKDIYEKKLEKEREEFKLTPEFTKQVELAKEKVREILSLNPLTDEELQLGYSYESYLDVPEFNL